MALSPLAGQPAPASLLVDVPKLITAYYAEKPDVAVGTQKVSFGTSGHRGSSLHVSFNEDHILAITQAICEYRNENGIDGPLFLAKDTHALSEPAFASALEVLAAHGVKVDLDVPPDTPAVLISAEQRDGPAYRVGFHNFYVITRYNHSARYAMTVYDLAAAIAARVRGVQP